MHFATDALRERLRLTVGALPAIDLDAIACESSEDELIKLVTQILAMAVMSPSVSERERNRVVVRWLTTQC